LKLKGVTIQNFMSIRKTVVELSDQGMLLVRGENNDDPAFDSNGSGKSTIFEAIVFAIYERVIRDIKVNEVINRDVGKNMCIFLDFIGDDNKEFRISRYRKHREHKNNTYIFQDGHNITPKSTKDSNAMIEDIFKMDFLTFTNSILFGGGLIKTFTVATDAEKKNILEKMLQLDVWSKAQDVAKKKLKEVEGELVEFDHKLQKSANLVDEIKQTIESLEVAEKEENENKKVKLKELKKSLKKAEEDSKEEISNLESELQIANDALTEKCAEETDSEEVLEDLEEIYEKVEKTIKKFKLVEEQLSDFESNKKMNLRIIKSNDNDIKKLRDEYNDIRDGVGTDCPVCGQEITEDSTESSLEHIISKIDKIESENDNLKRSNEDIQDSINSLNKTLKKKDKYEKQKDKILGEISELKASFKAEEKIRKGLQREISMIESSLEKAKKKLDVKRIEKQIEETKSETSNYSSLITSKHNQIDEITREVEEIKESTKDKQKRKEKLEFAVDAYGNSGIKSYLLDGVTPFLNKRANYYVRKLAGNTTDIEFSTQTRLSNGELRDKFEVRITNAVGGDSYKSNSTGERRRIDLAISLALQDLVMSRSNAKMNILLYDEIFDGLDAVGCENAIQLLQEIQKDVETIFVITHNDILKSFFDKSLIVTKEDGKTTVSKEG
jgi:DNA repair exonuclease SbcCD ATPase subunit